MPECLTGRGGQYKKRLGPIPVRNRTFCSRQTGLRPVERCNCLSRRSPLVAARRRGVPGQDYWGKITIGKLAIMAPLTAFSKSQSSKIINGRQLLALINLRNIFVNIYTCTTLNTPLGKPAAAKTSPKSTGVMGAHGDGL
uniref:Uncharacterized protein n=1 Tax=Romanomermis culicivorax TaxID=13658 RepID=A0A915IKL6_ROMCU